MTLRRKLLIATTGVMVFVWLIFSLYLVFSAQRMGLETQRNHVRFVTDLLDQWCSAGQSLDTASSVLDDLGKWGIASSDRLIAGTWPPDAPAHDSVALSPGEVAYQHGWWLANIQKGDNPALLVIQFKKDPAVASSRSSYFATSLWMVLIGSAMLLWVLYLVIERSVIRPLDELVEASRRLARGDFSRELATVIRQDEIGELMITFTRMQREIKTFQDGMAQKVQDAVAELTDSQRHLAVAQRLAATGRLAAGIAHEVNNPLGGMINAVGALQAGKLSPEKTAEYLALIQSGLARISRVMQRILTFSRDIRKPSPVHLTRPIEEAIQFVKHQAEAGNIRIKNEVEENLLPVLGDAAELQQVFLNLLLNACDAMRESGGEVVIQSRQTSGRSIVLVRDTGEGMDDETREHAFDYFYTTREVGEGSGLGLPIAYNIVSDHQGDIRIESRLGKGTVITVSFPSIEGS